MENKSSLIVKQNNLIEGFMDMTRNEYKLTLYLISKINKNDKDFRKQKISVNEFANLLGIGKDKLYFYLEQMQDSLLEKKIVVESIDEKEKKRLAINWFSYVKYSEGELEIAFNYDLAPYLLQIDTNFTKYFLDNVKDLNSVYATRIYELLKQYEPIGKRTIDIDDLKCMLGIKPNQYEKYGMFKKRVILKSQEELRENEETDIYFDFEEIKKGRKVTAIKFIIHSKKRFPEDSESTKTKKNKKKSPHKDKAEDFSEDNQPLPGQLTFDDSIKEQVKTIFKEPLEECHIKDLLIAANNDVEKIIKAYESSQGYINGQIKKGNKVNVVAVVISAIKNNYNPPVIAAVGGQASQDYYSQPSKFVNFKQREWDWEELERKERELLCRELKEIK
jgi:plasmid replication initiation protein